MKEITKPSREHIIHNALGGLYESTDICCPECNNYVSREIDKPFTSIFNPILGNIGPIIKTAKQGSTPEYTGRISYNNREYAARLRGDKILCRDLSSELKQDISKLPLKVVSYDFALNNDIFKNGMSKIAFNYALARGVNFRFLKPGTNITRNENGVSGIKFEYPMISFRPMNHIDTYLELDTPFEPYHHMVLFSQHNRLWCYIDLFNTFQYYILLSQTLPKGICVQHNYLQTLRKLNPTEIVVPNVKIFDPSDASAYAVQYGVDPTMDEKEMKRRIRHALITRPYKKDAREYFARHFPAGWAMDKILNTPDIDERVHLHQTTKLYFTEDNKINTDTFRIWTTSADGRKIISYPDALYATPNDAATREYTGLKFARLHAHMLANGK